MRDPSAKLRFERLYARARAPLARYLATGAAPDDVEDLVAEVLAVAWRRLEDIPPDAELPWLFGIARRVLANHRRADGRFDRLVERLTGLEPRMGGEPLVIGPDAEGAAALASLPRGDAEILRLWAWDQLAPREIADVLGITANAASIRLHRAKARLRARLEPAAQPEAEPQGTVVMVRHVRHAGGPRPGDRPVAAAPVPGSSRAPRGADTPARAGVPGPEQGPDHTGRRQPAPASAPVGTTWATVSWEGPAPDASGRDLPGLAASTKAVARAAEDMVFRSLAWARVGLVAVLAIAVVVGVTAWSWSFTTTRLDAARSTGVYTSPSEGMLTLLRAGYGGIEEAKVVSVQPETVPILGGPHVWFVTACVWAEARADGSPVGSSTHDFDFPGSYFMDTRDGWVLVPESSDPLLVGFWMGVLGLAGDDRAEPYLDPLAKPKEPCVRTTT
jgi:RNA polymerase sigma-70 factor, ECF subfamily